MAKSPELGKYEGRLLRPVKQRRAMLESNPSRNSRLETHPNEDKERRALARRSFVLERFPDASENSSKEMARVVGLRALA